MNSSEVFDLIERIAATSSKLEKQELVGQGMQDAEFARVVKYAYNPFKVYGIAKKRLAQVVGGSFASTLRAFNKDTWALLDKLVDGTYSGDQALFELGVELAALDEKSAQLLRRIVLKDLRAGFSESTVNKVAPGSIPEFPYMRCTLPAKSNIDKPEFWAEGAISQEKADGTFANTSVRDDGFVTITSRQGSPYSAEVLPELFDSAANTLKRGTQTHGELLVERLQIQEDGSATYITLPREDGNGVMNSLLSGGSLPPGHRVRLFAWDQVPLSAVVPKGKYDVTYRERLKALIEQVKSAGPDSLISMIDTRLVRVKEEAMVHYRALLAQGKEGTIVKSMTATWKDGTSKDQVKFKLEVPVELRIVGFEEGDGKYKGMLGAYVCESECGKLRVNVNGRGDAQRAEVWANKEKYLNGILTTKGNAIMSPSEEGGLYSLFLPVALEHRMDKSTADTLEQIKEQFAAAAGI